MKTNSVHVSSYDDYLELCSALPFQLQKQRVHEILSKKSSHFMSHLPFGSCLIDYPNRHYVYLSCNAPGILSYSFAEIMQGPEAHLKRMVPRDQCLFRFHLFPDILAFLKTVSPPEFDRYRFSFSYRFIRKDGSVASILQHGTYLEPFFDGKPLLNLVLFTDISDFKSNDLMTLTVSYLTDRKGYVTVYKKSYTPESTLISEREMQVLKLSLEGLSSKLIAERLYLSIHTVKNHKRNMMEKTSSKNISELIHYAVRHRLLE